MTILGWAQIALVLTLVVLCAIPLGRYLARVLNGERNVADAGVRPGRARPLRGWPACGPKPAWAGWPTPSRCSLLQRAAFRAAVSDPAVSEPAAVESARHCRACRRGSRSTPPTRFVTNTNWQAYSGEQTLSYGSQMWGLTVHNFLSAATGIAAAAAIIRAFARRGETLGNFWADVTRITLYVLLPLSLVVGSFLLISGRAADAGADGRGAHAGRREADHRARAGRLPGSDQAARHQRRRLLQRQLARTRSRTRRR